MNCQRPALAPDSKLRQVADEGSVLRATDVGEYRYVQGLQWLEKEKGSSKTPKHTEWLKLGQAQAIYFIS